MCLSKFNDFIRWSSLMIAAASHDAAASRSEHATSYQKRRRHKQNTRTPEPTHDTILRDEKTHQHNHKTKETKIAFRRSIPSNGMLEGAIRLSPSMLSERCNPTLRADGRKPGHVRCTSTQQTRTRSNTRYNTTSRADASIQSQNEDRHMACSKVPFACRFRC